MQLSHTTSSNPAPPSRRHFTGQASFFNAPTPAQLRFLAFVLATHEATATQFEEVVVPLSFIYPEYPAAGYDEAARKLFGNTSPVLVIRETNAAGRLVKRGSCCMMPLLSSVTYTEGEAYVLGLLNSTIIAYLPELLELLRPIMAAGEPAPLQRLAA